MGRCGGAKPHRKANHTLGENLCAAVKLARPNQQVIRLVGDGSFISGPTALWNMARWRFSACYERLNPIASQSLPMPLTPCRDASIITNR
jgi:hypothetical protein